MENKLPKVGDLILEYEENEYSSRDSYNLYKMFDSVVRKGVEVYLLETPYETFKAVTHTEFEKEISYFDGGAPMIVLELDNKNIQKSTHEESYSLFRFNVTMNYYELVFSHKSSDHVQEEILELANQKINVENFKKFLKNKTFEFKVSWIKGEYVFKWLGESA